MRREIVTTCTRDCPNACGLIAVAEGGSVTELKGNPRHSYTRGFACAKCRDFVRRAQSPERIVTPLRRNGSGWQRISWEAALDELAGRMGELVATRGPESILYYRGFAQRTALRLLNERFFNLLGGVTGTRGTLCGGTGQASQELDFGAPRISHDPLDHENSRTIILWGRNPLVTNPSLAAICVRLRERGGKVALVDPIANESRRLATLYVAPRPGSDCFLALGMAKIIIAQGKEDKAFVGSRCEGYGDYLRLLASLSLEECSRRCDVPVEVMEELARCFTDNGPTAVCLGWGLHRREYAHLDIRAIDALSALTGNLGIPGGGVSQGFDEYAPFDLSLTGDSLHPGRRKLLMPAIGREILEARHPEIGMIVVTAGNPVAMAPNAALVAEAFEKVPFVCVAGHFLDDTAAKADLFLPATVFMEEDDVTGSYGHNYVGPVNRAAEPPGECRSDFRLFHDLASRFPFAAEFRRSEQEWLAELLSPMSAHGVTPEEVMAGPVRIPWAPMVPYSGGRFNTPSARFRFVTGLEDVPSRCEDREYPYHLLSISPKEWLCSETTAEEGARTATVTLHPAEAERLGLAEGESVAVASPLGEIRCLLRLDPSQRRDTAIVPRGRWGSSGSSVNLLTRDVVSRVGKGAAYYETKVTVRK